MGEIRPEARNSGPDPPMGRSDDPDRTGKARAVGLSHVSTILWRERQLLELLLFKLEEEQLVLAAGRTRWLARATREVEVVLEEIRQTELARAVEVDALAGELRLPPNASLRQLVEAAPAPWRELLEDHRRAFLGLTEEIVTMAASNRELLARGYQAAREMLASFGDARADTYSPRGALAAGPSAPVLLDEVM
jgi:FlgN protein